MGLRPEAAAVLPDVTFDTEIARGMNANTDRRRTRWLVRQEVTMAEERLDEPWRPAFKTGQIFFGRPLECCDCLIWELRASGAMIELHPEAMPPHTLRLISIALLLNQPCEVVGRDGRRIELRFSSGLDRLLLGAR
ncbi:alkylhydroperoxidase/carboxymuconolactone decarboxylase family protein YurZ [Methylobacterium fujisawaense]|uniref:Alkylhydroperoxidase/carboxymuconolactone decarboxylase family protein YurZ n=1 Tax=Methylobacterium fujisawaense TaxID=107400 RepID=A0ABR6DB90_9HYPH|nr:hypothetical protein [Methylobacterium fujisawaense]MBA9063358.1 alkylhydroperoxidase/carboxymuconolactone decarboxylase family protein YurZ [Methylobacterium fujisawaense]